MRKIFLTLIFTIMLIHAEEYMIGNGIKIPNSNIYIGGYITADFIKRHDNYNRLRIDDIAFITYSNLNRFSYLGEFEIKNGYFKEWGKKNSQTTNTHLKIERLYFNYIYSDKISFKVGKFSTPVGYWNLTPIGVLRDSASNPYLAYILYPKYSTAIQIDYQDYLHDEYLYTLMLQNNSDLDERYNNIIVKKHIVVGIENIKDDLSFKANIGHFRTKSNKSFYYFLLSTKYDQEKYHLTFEYGMRQKSVPYALYIEGVYHVDTKSDIITRFETYKIDEGAFRKEHIALLGYTYRPISAITYKAEYQLRSYKNESQLKLSFSILF